MRLARCSELGRLIPFIFRFTTSDTRGAGTDADVSVTLHGEFGDTAATQLVSMPEHFERGQTDDFR